MNIDSLIFGKSAKRYSKKHVIPLNQGQEDLAKILGFKNYSAIQPRLELEVVEKPSAKPARSKVDFWCDLSRPAFMLLLACLKSAKTLSPDVKMFHEKGHQVILAAISAIESTGRAIESTAKLREALAFESMEARWSDLVTEAQEITDWNQWPALARPFGRYMDEQLQACPKKVTKKLETFTINPMDPNGTPFFDTIRIRDGVQYGQYLGSGSSRQEERDNYRRSFELHRTHLLGASQLLTDLETIEQAGGGMMRIHQLSSPGGSELLKKILEGLIQRRTFPEAYMREYIQEELERITLFGHVNASTT